MSIQFSFKEMLKNLVRKVAPPLLLDYYLKKFVDKRINISRNYQGVKPFLLLDEIHDSKFSKIHEKYVNFDSHLEYNNDKTRLRNYTLCQFAKIALQNTKKGDFLAAGISFGTSALIVSEFTELEGYNRRQFFIDPMDGRGRNDYNTSPELVRARWNKNIELIWKLEPLTVDSIQDIKELSFVHLNTNSFDAELSVLPQLINILVGGGVIVMDLYGWQERAKQKSINLVLDKASVNYFVSVTQQLIIFK